MRILSAVAVFFRENRETQRERERQTDGETEN